MTIMAKTVNKQREIFKIELGGKERTVRFTLNSLEKIEDSLGVPLSQMGEIELKIKNIKAILFAGLVQEEGEDLTPDMVGEWVDLDNLNIIQDVLQQAFGSAKN